MDNTSVAPVPATPNQTPPASGTPVISPKLPSFGVLYKEAWELLKHTFTSLTKLFFVSLVAILAVFAVIGVFVFLGSMLVGVLGDFAALLIIGALALFVFYLVSVIVISATSQITYIKIFTSETKLPVIKTMKESMPLVMPYFTTLLLMQLFLIGGVGLLIIPGIVFGILFSFTIFVFVVENLKGKAALKRSYQLVRPFFWKIVLVSLAIQIPVTIINQVIGQFSGDYPALILVSIPFAVLTNLFIQALSVVLYKHAKAIAPTDKPVSLKWITVIAVIGWILLAVLLVIYLGGLISSAGNVPLPSIPTQ